MATCEHSSGVAKAGLTTGIIGTSLAGLWALGGGNGSGLLGGILGNNRGFNCAEGAMYQSVLSQKDAEIAKLQSEKYTDQVGTQIYSNIQSNLKETYQELVLTRERLATNDANFKCLEKDVTRLSGQVQALDAEAVNNRVNNQRTADAIDCLAKNMNQRFESVYQTLDNGLKFEAERRKSGDNELYSYVNATFVPGTLKMSRDSICPEVMPRYNTWTAPTTEAPATTPVTGSINIGSPLTQTSAPCGC
jgi:hypothetical protein